MAKKVEKKPGFVPENAPAGLFINAQYLKDLSFENPNPLDAFKKDGTKPDISVNVNTSVKKLPDNVREDIKKRAANRFKLMEEESNKFYEEEHGHSFDFKE